MKSYNLKLRIFKIKNFFYYLFLIFIIHYLLLTINLAYAVCPLCTIAVGAGVEASRLLGVDDTISGIWIGGLVVSMSLWLADWLTKKNLLKKGLSEGISLIVFYFLTIPFLFWGKLIGNSGNTILGIDKIIFGIIFGSLVFFVSVWFENYLRKINQGKVFIYYQKVLLPLFFLATASLILFFLTF